jgi:hypothetical protein
MLITPTEKGLGIEMMKATLMVANTRQENNLENPRAKKEKPVDKVRKDFKQLVIKIFSIPFGI